MGCNSKRLAGSLTAAALNKKKDEEMRFNKAVGSCQAEISLKTQAQISEMRLGRERQSAHVSDADLQFTLASIRTPKR
ncbi:hypothetical protein WMY93_001986 [Mugilogobius chulae]|uniref:Uncharacterized protein n=1 Tax=Mugilogobius chulae TaxID=88201 RepID=A0AAW0Q0U5_9GOBI